MNKKSFIHILLLIFILFFIQNNIFFIFANSLEALDITDNSQISGIQNLNLATDKRYSTSLKIKNNSTISIETKENINAIYIMWQSLPDNYAVIDCKTQKKILSFNKNENIFLHQLIKLPTNGINNKLEIVIEGDNAILSELYLFSNGILPKFVQDWNAPYDKADILLLSTHADDEHIFFGGTMPYYGGEKNLKVQVAYLTNHFNYRVHELLNGLWEVGIKSYPIISNFPDMYAASLKQAKSIYSDNDIINYQVTLLRRFKPEVVIGHDLNGEYGHGGHMLNAECLTKAINYSSDSSFDKDTASKYGIWNVPKLYLHLYSENKLNLNWNVQLNKFQNKTALDMAKAGFAKHYSQTEFFSVGGKGVFDCTAFGLYYSAVGEDILKNDFFENLSCKNVNTSELRNFTIE